MKSLKKYWKNNPSSSLRIIISSFLKRNNLDDIAYIKSLIKNNSNEIESRKLMLDFAIHNSLWSLARENVTGLVSNNPDREFCEFMSQLEFGEHNDKQKSDAWLLRSQNSNLSKLWVCQISNIAQLKWSSVSNSGHFNSLEWMHPKMLNSSILNK